MTEATSKVFLDWIRTGLSQAGKTQSGLARHLNIAHPQITQLLNGRRLLKVDEIPKIAAYLELAPPSFSAEFSYSSDPEAQLRSALLAYGVHEDDMRGVFKAIAGFLYDDEDDDEPLEPDLRRHRSAPGTRRRISEPSE